MTGLPNVAASRHSNPFATCWTRPGALPFFPTDGQAAGPFVERLVEDWVAAGRRGQVVGPHGVGKSTLLHAVGGSLAKRGEAVRCVVFRADGPPPQLAEIFRDAAAQPSGGLLVDGLEQLSWWRRRRLLKQCHRSRLGLLATTHARVPRLPVLATLRPSLPLVQRLYTELTCDRPTPVTSEMAASVFAEVDGDVRELWFRLYDLHESLSRRASTEQAAGR